MKTTLRSLLFSTIFASFVLPAVASAHPDDLGVPRGAVVEGRRARHRVVRRRVRRRRVIVHPVRTEVIHERRVAYVPARRRRAPIYAAPHREKTGYWRDRGLLGIGLRMNGVATTGQKLTLSTLENPAMWGPGLTFTGRVAPRWDLEFGLDYLIGAREDYRQRTVPLTLTGMFLFFPDSRVTPYALFGGGVHFTQLSYGEGAFVQDITEFGAHAGGGVKIRLGHTFALTADVRANLVYANLGDGDSITRDCRLAGVCRVGYRPPDDKINLGVTFQAGGVFYF